MSVKQPFCPPSYLKGVSWAGRVRSSAFCTVQIYYVTSGKRLLSLGSGYSLLGNVASWAVDPTGRALLDSSKGRAEGVIKGHDLWVGHSQ